MTVPKQIKSYADKEKALNYRNRQRKLNYANGAVTVKRNGKRWDKSEDKLILSGGKKDRELSNILNRSVQAIQVRRCRISNHEI